MSKGPWGTEPRTAKTVAHNAVKSPIARFLGTALIVTALFGSVLFAKYQTHQSSKTERMPTSAYGELVKMTQVCPIMRRPIRLAMADGFLTRGETISLRATADEREKAYVDAASRQAAAAAVGAPGVPVPAKCENTGGLLGSAPSD